MVDGHAHDGVCSQAEQTIKCRCIQDSTAGGSHSDGPQLHCDICAASAFTERKTTISQPGKDRVQGSNEMYSCCTLFHRTTLGCSALRSQMRRPTASSDWVLMLTQ